MTLDVRPAGEQDLPALHALRHEVFVVGQGVPVGLERDDRDATAEHVVAYLGGRLVGTGRLLVWPDGTGSIGRMAVADGARGQGVGTAVLRRLEARATELGLTSLELHAQVHAVGFYDRAGYQPCSDVYLEAGLEHQSMRKDLAVGAVRAGDVTVRPVRDDDADALIVLIGGCWSAYPGVELHVDAEEPWLRAPATAYRQWDGRMDVVELAGEVVACCGVRPKGDGVVELKSMYVAAAARRRGIARLLEARVWAEAARRGAVRVELWSDTRFLEAHATYAALGYRQLPGQRDLQDLSQSFEFAFVKEL